MRWGVILSSPGDLRVLEKMVCHNERSALTRGRAWKRRCPDHVVRAVSLMPGDSSPAEEIPFVRRRQVDPPDA